MRNANTLTGLLVIGGVAVGSLVLERCGYDRALAPTRVPQQHDISDANHNAGNPHFFFLPPMVPQPAYAGATDPNESPTVVICAWAANACNSIVATFSRETGAGAQLVRYDSLDQQYIVNWNTSQCDSGACTLDPSKTYRLRVLVGALELGHADLDLVANASQLKNVETSEYIALVDGRTLPVKFRIESGAVALIAPRGATSLGATGGTIATSDGQVALEVPPGALASTTTITVGPAAQPSSGLGGWATPVDLGPTGTTFAAPVALTLRFDPTKLPQGIPLSALRVFTQVDSGWTVIPGAVVDSADDQVTAPISHFSTYGVGIAPNYVSGAASATSVFVGQDAQVVAFTFAYQIVPMTYCYPYSYWVSSPLGGYWVYGTSCYTVYQGYFYYLSNLAVDWSSSAPTVLGFQNGSVSYTNSNGIAMSPPASGLLPGATTIAATAAGVPSNAVTDTVLGRFTFSPKTTNDVAGWTEGELLKQGVALPESISFTITDRNTFLTVGEPGTGNYTYGGQTGSYLMPSGATSKVFGVFGLNGPGVDTLIASAAFFVPDTAIVTLVKGSLLITGWPVTLAVGDSAPLQLTAGDPGGAPVGNLAYPVTFQLAARGLAFSEGNQPITTVTVAQRTSAVFYVKALAAGTDTLTISDRDYATYLNTVNATPAIVQYQAVSLGTLGGTGTSDARSINGSGRITGQSNDNAYYVDPSASLTQIPSPFGNQPAGDEVNDSGTVAVSNGYNGYLFDPSSGAMLTIPGPFVQNNKIFAAGINNRGLVLACADNGNFAQNYVWNISLNSMTLIPGAYNICDGKINDSGLAVVSADPGSGGHAYIWNNNTQTETILPSLGGWMLGRDINAQGVVVGTGILPTGLIHAFSYDPETGQLLDLGTLGGAQSQAMAVNGTGLIVGWSNDSSGAKVGFIWNPSTRRMTVLPPLPGDDESSAADINDQGVIVGYSAKAGVQRAVYWKP